MDSKSLLKHLIVLALLVVVILNAIAFVLVWRLDVFIHDDLYDFGLIMNFDWANDYWYNAKTLWTFIAGTVAMAIASIIPHYIHHQKSSKITKILGFLLPTLASICQAISIFYLWQIDFLVHNRLIEFGIPINFDWDVLYNPLSTTALTVMATALATLIISAIVILFLSGIVTMLSLKLTQSNLSDYLKTKNARWYWITTIFALITSIVVFVTPENLHPWSYTRIILGSIFILYLPGYTVIKTLFPTKIPIKASGENLDEIERITLSLGVSFAIAPMVGLLLNYTSWGIRLIPIVLCLFAFSMIFASIALIREYQIKLKADSLERNVHRR